MLELSNIKKNYYVGEETVEALKGVSIKFRKSEFVSILGPSGCGKTTMLNIIGGLDRYTSGDLFINETSTKMYKDSDWDTYRNHSIGFIFQNYNLIPHQTVVENVELALTLSGVSKADRRKKAIEVLQQVGLEDKINSKPSQLSGGQMQRVAIARALINDPDILLADEPTGALDTKTSVQIMDILKSISQNKLIIMVTHNPELAETYSNRIIKLVDGEVVSDSNPYIGVKENNQIQVEEVKPEKENVEQKLSKKRKKNTSMSFFTALALSFKNLLTKKGRTIMVAFAGSIGIIGIALIMSVSNGFQAYIDKVQEDTLSTYPISLKANTTDFSSMITEMQGTREEKEKPEEGYITSNNSLAETIKMMQKMMALTQTKNNLGAFKNYIESSSEIKEQTSAIQYVYDFNFNIYNQQYQQVNPNEVFKTILGEETYNNYISMSENSGMNISQTGMFNVWAEMLDNMDLIKSQYDLVDGDWPSEYNQIVIIVDGNNQISDYVLYSLGLKDISEIENALDRINNGETLNISESKFTYEDVLNLKYKITMPYDMYEKQNGIYVERVLEGDTLKEVVDKGIELEVVGILKAKDSASATSIKGSVAYTSALTDKYIELTGESTVLQEQMANPETNIFTGLPFVKIEFTEEMINTMIDSYVLSGKMTPEQGELFKAMFVGKSSEEIAEILAGFGVVDNDATYENNLKKLGYIDKSNPITINIYPINFEAKEIISGYIADYNAKAESEGRDGDIITYTDYISLLLDSITDILDVVTYVLIAFVAISLVVSSIMIGVITYISVLERTKEIGILRSIGARKKDISRVFTAETVVIGFAAGVLGILVTLILTIPINMIINFLAEFTLNAARLPIGGAIILVLISMLLTVIAGLIPSKFAANRDPVEALRTE